MFTGRDDFVIAVRSAFLKKETQQRFSLLGLILFSILFIYLGTINFKAINYIKIAINEIVYRSSFIVSGPENFIKEIYYKVDSHFKLYHEHKDREIELESLKSKSLLNKFMILENKRLKSIIDDYLLESDEIVAKVLIDKQSPFLKSIVANKGSKHNIKLGMSVLDGEYLIGKVVEVNYLTSRILLLSDLNSKIPISIEPKGILSILSGTGKKYGIIQYLKSDYNIEDSSIVYTSGSGGLIKAGVPVGKIINLNNESRVSFFSDFTQLNFVKIIFYKKTRIETEKETKLND
jgi:rod shape-determining protein MreC